MTGNGPLVNLGILAGTVINHINVGYDQWANTGGYRGHDDITISNSTMATATPVAPTATPTNTSVPPAATSTPRALRILVYVGSGTTSGDDHDVIHILRTNGYTYTYDEVNEGYLNSMSLGQLAQYRLIVFPGGNSNTMTRVLTAQTRENVREAVVNDGVNYLGFCAGAWMAQGPTSTLPPAWGFSFVNGPIMSVYPAVPNPDEGDAAWVKATFASGMARTLIWADGPETPAWTGGVIARYPNGTAVMSETRAGKGFVVITGMHPEADPGWIPYYNLPTPAPAGFPDYDVASALLNAAYTGQPFQAF